MTKENIILYHANCSDGFGGAWVAHKKFEDEADYIGITHQDSPPENLGGKSVYMIDIVFDKRNIDKLLKEVKSLVVIDHHITMEDVVKSVPNHVYAVENSGAVLAWKYFFPDKKVPLFLEYIEDGDLWNFDLPRSEDFYSFIPTIPFEFDKWDKLAEEFENESKRKLFLDYGKSIRDQQDKMIEELLEEAEEVIFENYSALVLSSVALQSKLGNAIITKGYDIGIIWNNLDDDVIKVSLRSNKNGNVDVGAIAKKYGGGGHQSAAGFVLGQSEEFPWQATQVKSKNEKGKSK